MLQKKLILKCILKIMFEDVDRRDLTQNASSGGLLNYYYEFLGYLKCLKSLEQIPEHQVLKGAFLP
jgi:hypothetical protein